MAHPHGIPAHELTGEDEARYEAMCDAMEDAKRRLGINDYPYRNHQGVWVQDTIIDITNLESPLGGEFVKGQAVAVECMED